MQLLYRDHWIVLRTIALQNQSKEELVDAVKQALYASKITSYAQGLNIIKAKSDEKGWNVDLGEISRIWKVSQSPSPQNPTLSSYPITIHHKLILYSDWQIIFG